MAEKALDRSAIRVPLRVFGPAAPKKMLMSVQEAAPLIGIGQNTLREMIRRERLPLPTYRVGRNELINMAHVQDWIDVQTPALGELLEAKRRLERM